MNAKTKELKKNLKSVNLTDSELVKIKRISEHWGDINFPTLIRRLIHEKFSDIILLGA